MQKKYGFTPLGPAEGPVKTAIFSGNNMRLYGLQKRFAGRMLVNAKCAPHYVKTLFETDGASPFLKAYAGGAGGCPADGPRPPPRESRRGQEAALSAWR